MPAFLYVRSRNGLELGPEGRSKLETLARRLAPDNISPVPLTVAACGDAFLALFNGAGPTVRREQTSVCLGPMFDFAGAWWKIGSGSPDGSFALLRSDHAATELTSDAVGTRTVWYAHTAELFVASTSQRAIVMWLESYACNLDAFAWQISSGTLGPGLSWDRRIRALPPSSTLLFDARSWSARLTSVPVEYLASAAAPERQRRALQSAIVETFRGFELDTEHGALALSGGYDSRMILLMLRKGRPRLRTVTWGRRAALADRGNDACIAQRLAAELHTEHSYYELELTEDRVEPVLDRFVRLGEGRTENIGAYTDGFAAWKALHERRVSSVFRGDEAFGCRFAATATDVYANMKCNVLGDYHPEGVRPFADLLPAQARPGALERRQGESHAAWRDRLNAEFELPYVISALNDLKFGYVDVVHPLLSRRIVEQARRLPDDMRTGKRAFKQLVEEVPLRVPFAKRSAVATPDSVLRQPAVVRLLRERLAQYREGSGTVAALAGAALDLLETASAEQGAGRSLLRRVVAKALPRYHTRAPSLPPLRVAFRTYVIGKMQGVLENDSRALR
jgi:asparagine synthetase B (glutamine-hydrolysing)